MGHRFLGDEDEEKENDDEQKSTHREGNEVGDLNDRYKGLYYGFEERKDFD